MNGLLGYDGIDPIAAGLLSAGGALMTPRQLGGGVVPAMAAAGHSVMGARMTQGQLQRQAQQDALREQLLRAQMANYTSEAEQRKAIAEARAAETQRVLAQQRGQSEYLARRAAGSTPGFRDASIAAGGTAPPGYAPPSQRQGFTQADMAEWIALGGDPNVLKSLAEAGNLGRPKVAGTVRTTDAQGAPVNRMRDDYGNFIGDAIPEPVETKYLNTGNAQTGIHPFTGQPRGGAIPMQLSPSDVQQARDAAAGRGVTMRGQDMSNDRMIELAQLQRDMQEQARIAAAGAAATQRADKGAADLAGAFQQGGLPAVYASISSLNNKLLGKKDVNQVDGLGAVPALLNKNSISRLLLSSEAKDTRSQVQAVSNDLLKMYSGLAVTLPESERRALEMMSEGTFSATDFANAWPRVVERFNQTTGNLTAGQTPEAVRTYSQRPGAMPTTPLSPAFKKDTPAAPSTIDDLVRKYSQGK